METVNIYSDIDLDTLVRLGREAEALSHARLRSDPARVTDGILAVYAALEETGAPKPSLLDEALRLSKAASPKDQVPLLGKIAVMLDHALDARADATFTAAQEAAEVLFEGDSKTRALEVLTAALAKADRHVEAEKTARLVQDAGARASALGYVMATLVRARDPNADRLWDEAYQLIASTELTEFARDLALRKLAESLASANLCERANTIAASVKTRWLRAAALRHLAVAWARAGQFDAALLTARRISGNEWYKTDALAVLATALAQAGNGRADACFAEAENAVCGTEASARLANALARSRKVSAAERIFEEAHARTPPSPRQYAKALLAIAVALDRLKKNQADALLTKRRGRPSLSPASTTRASSWAS
jgi:hypothetical protein